MLKPRHGFYFNIFITVFCLCNNPVNIDRSSFTFSVFDVGQGLSQIAVKDSHAIVWDLGPPCEFDKWKSSYEKIGRPYIDAVVISHSDLDHSGGLYHLDTTIKWNGNLVMSRYEDSTCMKKMCCNWKQKINCKIIREGDNLNYLNGVDIQCIWPFNFSEHYSDSGELTNFYSLVFILRYNSSQVIITSDIDSVAEQFINIKYGIKLMSDLMIVPHHGSAFSVNRTFFGYIRPQIAVISCSKDNAYKHPSDAVLDLLMQLGTEIFITYSDGPVYLRSNGYYWEHLR